MGIGAALAAGSLGYYLYERSTEQPRYRLITKDGDFEVRTYPKMLVAEVITSGEREEALNSGFRKLAGYIFAKSRGGEKIAMTAPVLQDREPLSMTAPVLQSGAGEKLWRTRFIMPAGRTPSDLPSPPADIHIEEIGPRNIAAVRFSGRASDLAIAEHAARLTEWMSRQSLKAGGDAVYAFYNSPFIPPFLRRNEILIPVGN